MIATHLRPPPRFCLKVPLAITIEKMRLMREGRIVDGFQVRERDKAIIDLAWVLTHDST